VWTRHREAGKEDHGVEEVKTAVMLNKMFIDYDPKLIDSNTIREAIDKTGYKSYMSIEEKKALEKWRNASLIKRCSARCVKAD
jgi:hypothetical protein